MAVHCLPLIKWLVEHGAKIDGHNEPLLPCVAYNIYGSPAVRYLVEEGLNPNTDINDHPLKLAMGRSRETVLYFLDVADEQTKNEIILSLSDDIS